MNRRFAVLAVLLALALPVLYADIGENFAKGGTGFSGGGSVYLDFSQLLNSADEHFYWSVAVVPTVDFFPADRFSLYLSPWFSYAHAKIDADNVTNTTRYGLEAGLSYAFVGDLAAQRGLVPTIGAGLAVAFYPGNSGMYSGTEFDSQSQYVYLRLGLPLRLLFFLNDRLAPYVGLGPRVWYLLSARGTDGTSFSPPSEARFSFDVSVTFGISFHVPNRKASLFLND